MVNNHAPGPAPDRPPVTPEQLIVLAKTNMNSVVTLLGRYQLAVRPEVRRQLLQEAELAADISVAYSTLAIAMLAGEQLQVLKESRK